MTKRIDFSLSNEQLENLEEAIKFDEQPEVVKRAMALRLLHYGHRPEAVAEMLLVTASTVYQWHHRFQRHLIFPKFIADVVQQLQQDGLSRPAGARLARRAVGD